MAAVKLSQYLYFISLILAFTLFRTSLYSDRFSTDGSLMYFRYAFLFSCASSLISGVNQGVDFLGTFILTLRVPC
jgi:hypothetical protein